MKCFFKICIVLAGAVSGGACGIQAETPDEFLRSARAELDDWRDDAVAELAAYRDSVMAELAAWIDKPWLPAPIRLPEPPPHMDEPPVPPLVIPPDEPQPIAEDKPVTPSPVVVPPAPVSPPAPPEPVLPPPVVTPPVSPQRSFVFTSYGTRYVVDASPALRITIGDDVTASHNAVSRALDLVDNEAFERLSSSMLKCRNDHRLSDWAYFKLTGHFAEAFLPGKTNEQKLLQGLLLLAGGYDVRFGGSPSAGRIYLWAGFDELIFNEPYFTFGSGKRYYSFETAKADTKVSDTSFPGTRSLTAQPTGREKFDMAESQPRRLMVCTHRRYCGDGACAAPALDLTVTTNLNRMEFYSDCPQWKFESNDDTDWHTYARTRLSDEVECSLYPAMREALAGLSEEAKANFLMRFVEQFPYGLDSEIWGRDRAFFPDETIHYPRRDCEDGAILFSRLVSDLIGVPVALVYYPGHLAAAVAFDSSVAGAYIPARGRKYVVCDPTYYYVNVGVQMPPEQIDASKAVLIPVP